MMINKQRLIGEFIELVQIDSPSSREGAVAKALIYKLEQLGFDVRVDNAGSISGGETGNVIAILKGNRPGKTVLFSSHMDTVSPGEGIKPIIDEINGVIRSDGTTVLGSDDKGGIAAILEAMRIIKENRIEHSDIQIVFSILEEGGLLGAKYLDYSTINPDFAFVLDSDGAPGQIVVKAPAQDRIVVKIKGKPAHAGFCPENGISAVMVAARAIERMKLLRIDAETTANIGTIKGGIATNIVMPDLEIVAAARSLDNAKLDAQTQHMVDTFKEAAVDFGAEVEIKTERIYEAFCIDENDEIVSMLKNVFSNMNIEYKAVSSGGGSDTNIFNAKGLKAVNLGVGMKNAHTLEECISIDDLMNSVRMVVEIVKEA
ncbi:Peptidase T [Sporomusa rhizae]|uniref:M20/M25/M40 family metallo-hydrolase n=1 Tax=Sporomusa rhizae TaxID=357999 RepID=UPI00352B58D6